MSERARLLTLAADLKSDLDALARLQEDVETVLRQFSAKSPSRLEMRIPASLLHDYYTGVEAALARVVETLNGGYPTGPESHRRLLELSALEVDGVRPAVISQESADALDEFRRFRHMIRHAYAARIEWDQLKRLLQALPKIHHRLAAELEQFIERLTRIADALDG